MKRHLLVLFCILMATIVFISCKKDEEGSGLKAVFSYVADGYKVNFTNFSSNAKTYTWDFGDGSGQTSSSKAPQHVFTAKGDFLVSLTASNGTETNTFLDTVTIIGPNIKIDNDLSDWQYVSYTYENPESFPGTLRAVKTFASSTDIFFLLEGTTGMNIELFDMYIDADNNSATGFSTYLYPAGSGADFLLEGPPVVPGWGSVFEHSGPPAGFTFTPVLSFDEVMNFSPISTVSGKKIMEFSIKKSALGTISGAINFAFIELSGGWAELGKIPAAETPESRFITVPL